MATTSDLQRLQRRLIELEESIEAKDAELSALRRELFHHKLEVEETVTYVAKRITGANLFSEAASFAERLGRIEQENRELRYRLDRYTRLPFLKQIRKVRARLLGLPVPE